MIMMIEPLMDELPTEEDAFEILFEVVARMYYSRILSKQDFHDVRREVKKLKLIFQKIDEHGYYDLEYD